MNEQIEPLPYNIPPPTPRPSFTRNLQLSSYLFPSNLRLSVSSSSTRSEEDKQAIERICNRKHSINHTSMSTQDSQATTMAKSIKFTKKVTFQCKVQSIPPQHVPTEDEKQRIFYNKEDYDRFKFDAAQNAGVRLFDYFPPEEKQPATADGLNATVTYPHKFVMMGNFDKEDKPSSLPTDATVASKRKPAASQTYHVPIKCQSEYNDKGDDVCKRGLGYHFSRYRKRNRVWTRAMVLTWQKTMRGMKLEDGRILDQEVHSQQQPLKLSQKCDVQLNENSRKLLAVVSSKCSQTAKQAALWRGKMDYAMAHPENRKVSFDLGPDDKSASVNKRAANDCEEQSRRKRQRYDTSNTYSYLGGVLAVPI
jgi:hypothetical protein